MSVVAVKRVTTLKRKKGFIERKQEQWSVDKGPEYKYVANEITIVQNPYVLCQTFTTIPLNNCIQGVTDYMRIGQKIRMHELEILLWFFKSETAGALYNRVVVRVWLVYDKAPDGAFPPDAIFQNINFGGLVQAGAYSFVNPRYMKRIEVIKEWTLMFSCDQNPSGGQFALCTNVNAPQHNPIRECIDLGGRETTYTHLNTGTPVDWATGGLTLIACTPEYPTVLVSQASMQALTRLKYSDA